MLYARKIATHNTRLYIKNVNITWVICKESVDHKDLNMAVNEYGILHW